MPTIFAHGAIGFTAAKTFSNNPSNDRLVVASVILAMLPDIDGLFFNIIPHRHPLAHRGLTHSLIFAVAAGLITALISVHNRWNNGLSIARLAAFFALVTASHGFFDAMTDGGQGIAFLAPFDNNRYFFPFRPIPVSPMTIQGLLSERGWHVIQTEIGLFWTFASAVAVWDRGNKWRIGVAIILVILATLAWLRALNQGLTH